MGSPTNTRNRKRLLGGTVMLAAALTATGCGSRESGPSVAQQAPAAAANTTADTTAAAPAAAAGAPVDAATAGTPDATAGTTAAAPGAAAEPVAGGAGKPVAGGAGKQFAGAATKAVAGAATKPVAGAATKPVAGAATKPVAGAATKPVAGAATEPVAGAATEPVAGAAAKSGAAGGQFANEPGTSPGGPAIDIKGADSQGITPTSIKLGVIAPVSGAAGFLGEAEVAAIRAYTSLVNAKGGVNGRKYTTVIADSQFEPSLEAQAARKLVDQDKVFALFSVLGDSTGPFVTSKGIPTMVFGLNPPAFSSKYPTTHVTGFSTMDSVTRMAYDLKVLQKKPINTTAVLYDTSNIPIAPWAKYLAAAWKAVGVEVKSTDAFNISDGDCTPVVLKVQSEKVDFWQSGQSLGWPACAAAMGRQHYHPPLGFGGPYTSDNKFITQGGPVGMDGAYGEQVGIQVVQSYGQPYTYGGQLANDVAPLADEYVNSLKKYAPNSADTDTLESIWTQTFWTGVQALTKAIDVQTGAITWQGINQWFWSQKHYKSGIVAPIDFDPKCKSGSPVWLYQWKFNKEKNVFIQTSWKENGGPFTVPDAILNKIVPGAGQCYLTKAADNEL